MRQQDSTVVRFSRYLVLLTENRSDIKYEKFRGSPHSNKRTYDVMYLMYGKLIGGYRLIVDFVYILYDFI